MSKITKITGPNNHQTSASISNSIAFEEEDTNGPEEDKKCHVCKKKFGLRKMRRKHRCRRCNLRVCNDCSKRRRYDVRTQQSVRVCDTCLSTEKTIYLETRLRDLKLKYNKKNAGTYIWKVDSKTKEYKLGLVTQCKIIQINGQNVENMAPQHIADRLNTIKIPYTITLDYNEAESTYDNAINNDIDSNNYVNKGQKIGVNVSQSLIQKNQIPKSPLNEISLNNKNPDELSLTNNVEPIDIEGKQQNTNNNNNNNHNNTTTNNNKKDSIGVVTPLNHELSISKSFNPINKEYNDDSDTQGSNPSHITEQSEVLEFSENEDDIKDNNTKKNENKNKNDEIKKEISNLSLSSGKIPVTRQVRSKSFDEKDSNNIKNEKKKDDDIITKKKSIDDMFIGSPNDNSNNKVHSKSRLNRLQSQPALYLGRISMKKSEKLKKKQEKMDKKYVKKITKRKDSLGLEHGLMFNEKDLLKSKKKKLDITSPQMINNHVSLQQQMSTPVRSKQNTNIDDIHINGNHNNNNNNNNNYKQRSIIKKNIIDQHKHNNNNNYNGGDLIQYKNYDDRYENIKQSLPMYLNPHRQFSVIFRKRPFNIKLQMRKCVDVFSGKDNQGNIKYIKPQYIWGWYSIIDNKKIPLGSKLLAINFNWLFDKSEKEIGYLIKSEPLPVTFIFEAPQHLKSIPLSETFEIESIYNEPQIQNQHRYIPKYKLKNFINKQSYNNHINDTSINPITNNNIITTNFDEFDEDLIALYNISNNKSGRISISYLYLKNINLINWWIRDGGWILFILILLTFYYIDYNKQPNLFKLFFLFIISLLICILLNIKIVEILIYIIWTIRWLFSKKKLIKYKKIKYKQFNNNKNIINNNNLNEYSFEKVKKSNKKKIRRVGYTKSVKNDVGLKENKEEEINGHYSEEKIDFIENELKDDNKLLDKNIDNETSESKQEPKLEIDPNWETNIVHSEGNSHTWGSYQNCTGTVIKLRGKNYLKDSIKVPSKEMLFNLAHFDIFISTERIFNIAQHRAGWFYRNKYKLPKHLFFFIVHIRLNSYKLDLVQYFYIDKNKFNIDNLSNKEDILNQFGNEYFCIGDKSFDETGLFWKFINGECKYRNDRLKIIARKEDGPFYLIIPNKPAIIGKKIPTRYYRCYNKSTLNDIKLVNSNSKQHETYNFNILHNNNNNNNNNDNNINNKIPCNCDKCEWIDNKNEYCEYLEIDIDPEVNAVAKNTIRMAVPLAKSLKLEMFWTLEPQNENELPERIVAGCRLNHVFVGKVLELD